MEPYAQQVGFEARDAGCDRAGAAIVRGVSFTLKPGDALQLFGPNGSGKSSLLSMFAGLYPPAAGEICWTKNGASSFEPFDSSVFFLGHDASVKLSLTAEENLIFWAQTYGSARGSVGDAIKAVGAEAFAHLRASGLSAGQKRRVDLARAVLAQRPVWLLDEPTAAVDRDGIEIIRKLTEQHRERGGIAVIATHDDLGSGFQRLELGR